MKAAPPYRALARRAFADAFGSDVLKALADRSETGGLLPHLRAAGGLPHGRRAFLPLFSFLLADHLFRVDDETRGLLRAARLHESLRLAAIDTVAALAAERLVAAGLQALIIDDHDLARHYPNRALRHIHALRLWVPSTSIREAGETLRSPDFERPPAVGAGEVIQLRHANGCRVLLTPWLAPGLGARTEAILVREVVAAGAVLPEVSFIQLIGRLLVRPSESPAQHLIDAHFLCAGQGGPGPLADLAARTGLSAPVAALIELVGGEPASLGFTSRAADLALPAPLLRRLALMAWRRGGRDLGVLFRDAGGLSATLRIAEAVAGLGVTAAARRLGAAVA